MLKKHLQIGIIIFITTLLISCGATPKNALVGKWADAGQEKSGDYMEFLDNHTVVMKTKAVPTPVEGTWVITASDAIQVDLMIGETKQQLLFELEDDQLVATGPKGTKNKLVKL